MPSEITPANVLSWKVGIAIATAVDWSLAYNADKCAGRFDGSDEARRLYESMLLRIEEVVEALDARQEARRGE